MEHILFVTLSLVAILLWFRARDVAPSSSGAVRSSILAGIALGALGMTRPEGLALSVLLFALYRWCGRTLADVLRAAVCAASVLRSSAPVKSRL